MSSKQLISLALYSATLLTSQAQSVRGQALATPSAYHIVQSTLHDRVWQSDTLAEDGAIYPHSFVEVATGLNFLDAATGQLAASDEGFQISKTGSAVAQKTQHKVSLAADIKSQGSVELITPDGQKLLSTRSGASFATSMRRTASVRTSYSVKIQARPLIGVLTLPRLKLKCGQNFTLRPNQLSGRPVLKASGTKHWISVK